MNKQIMNFSNIDCKKSPSRQARLRAWMALHGVTNLELARRIGVHYSTVSLILNGHRAPADRIEALVAVGVPEELLPEAQEPKKRGRKPKTQATAAGAAA